MKKFNLFFLLISSLFLLAACNAQESMNETDAPADSKMNSETVPLETESENNESNTQEDNAEKVKYENDGLGFEFMHDKKWVIDNERTDDTTVVFIDETGVRGGEEREAVTVQENTNNSTLEQIVDQFMKEGNLEVVGGVKSQAEDISGEKAIKVETDSFGMNYYFILHDNRIYKIETQNNLFNEETLKTFQFTS